MHILASYAFIGPRPDAWYNLFRHLRALDVRTLIDSGAYTAYTIGRTITLPGYVSFLRQVGSAVDEYIMLDVVAQRDATLDNWRTMVGAGLRPMGVMTLDMDAEQAQAYAAVNPRMCVAGGATRGNLAWYPARIETIHRVTGGVARMHGLGFTAGTWPLRTKVSSVDSSTWCVGHRYGKLSVFGADTGCVQLDIREIRRQRFADMDHRARRFFIASGIDANVLSDRKASASGLYSVLTASTVCAWLEYAQLLKARGCAMYFALVGVADLGLLATVMMHRNTQGGIDWRSFKADAERVRLNCRKFSPWFWSYLRDALRAEEERGVAA